LSLALAARSKLRFAGRSFLAFVLEPSPSLAAWLADLDAIARQSSGFFVNRPVVLDLKNISPDKAEVTELLDALAARAIRVIAVEGIDPALAPPALAPLAGGVGSAKIIDFPGGDTRRRPEAADSRRPINSLLLDRPVRSGQSVFFPHGDLTVIGAVASGAEVIAGGSIHIEGALRGRAFAGAAGNTEARIFCRKFEAELVAIDGNYLTAEQCAAELIGRPVQIQLNDGAVMMGLLD